MNISLTQQNLLLYKYKLSQKVLSADNLCKKFGPKSGPKKCQACPESNCLMIKLINIFQKLFQEYQRIFLEKGNLKKS